MINQDDLLFCEVAIRLGKATKAQVEQALCKKADLEAQGFRFRIGEVLASTGVLDRPSVDQILEVQAREVFSCTHCGAHFLIGKLKPGTRIKCGKCSNAMTVPELAAASGTLEPAAAAPPPTPASPTVSAATPPPTEIAGSRPRDVKAGMGTRLGVPDKAEKDAAVEDRMVGTVLARCTLALRIGVGGWGTVYRARHQITGKDFAIKVLSPNLAANEETVQRFFKEAKLTAHLGHPAIRQVHDAGVEKGHHFLVMEYIDGAGLRTLVDQNDPYDPETAVRIMLQVVSGLSLAAEAGITHRDIKPQNILIDKAGRAKITDFGLAKAAHETSELTATGAVLGTPEYMSPEQFEGRPADLRSDIYSLGCTLFFILTGHPPFEAKDLFTLMNKHRQEPPPSPRKFNSRIPYPLCKVISRMLEKSQQHRYANYADLCVDLQSAIAGGAAQPVGPGEEKGGVAGGSSMQQWMTEERSNQCSEIQGELIEMGFVPPASAEILPRLGIEGDLPQREHSESGSDFALPCRKCGRKAALTRAVVEKGFACPNCRGGSVAQSGSITLERKLCYVVASVNGALDDSLMAELSILGEHITCSIGYNLVLDLGALEVRGGQDVNSLAAYLQRLVRVSGIVLVATGESKLRESLLALGLGEFLRVLEPKRPFDECLEAGAVCPHAQEAMGLLRGLAGYSEEGFPERVETACRACPKGEHFQTFYKDLADVVRKGNLDALRSGYDDLIRRIDAPCMTAVAERVHLKAEEGIRIGLEKRGREFLKQGDRAKAEKYAVLLARNFPRHPASHDLAGCVALAQKALAEAVKAFTRAVELAEDPREFQLNRATALLACGDKAAALKDLDAVVAKSPGDFQALLRRGLLQMELSAYAEAGKDFDRAIALAPDSAIALNARGKVRHRTGSLKGAAEDFEEAARLDPTEPTYHANCGALYSKVNDLEKATRHLERALELQPNLSTPRYNLACVAVKRGDKARALELLDAAVTGGFTRVELLRTDADLAPLRAMPEFAVILKKAETPRGNTEGRMPKVEGG